MTKSKKSKSGKPPTVASVQGDLNSQLVKLNSLIVEAEAAIDTFNYDEAELKLQEILQIDPNNCKSLEMLSSVYIEKFNWENAKTLLQRCIEISPENGYSKYFSMGQLYDGFDSVKYYEKGIQTLEKELENSENIESSKEISKSKLQRSLSDAYCSVAEIFMTDCCFEENAEQRCHTAIDMAIKSDPNNPEAYQCLANFQLVKRQDEEAKLSIEKNLSLWLPHHEAVRDGELDLNSQIEAQNKIPGYDSRIKTSKLLIELNMFYEANKILEGLVEEDDEVVEVWYLLGWLNYTQGEEYKANAHFFFKKAKEVSIKLGLEDDDYVDHVNELLEELKTTHPISDDEQEEENFESDSDSEWISDSDDNDKME